MSLEACLPAELRGPATTITSMEAGLSGAEVYRVDAAGRTLVLKISAESEPLSSWRRRLRIQRLAAAARLAPAIIHADEGRRALVSVFVTDRSFAALYADPRSRETAIVQLGRTIRQVHELPLPEDAAEEDPRELLAAVWAELAEVRAVPGFAADAIRGVLAEVEPARERASVLSHNDVNPTNLVHDGANLLLLDWDRAGRNDPVYDLAAISVFLLMDDPTCERLLAAYDGAPNSGLPARFAYNRRLVAVLCGSVFLQMARRSGCTEDAGPSALDSTPTLAELYQRMGGGSLSLATGDGQWWFGLALIKAGVALGAGQTGFGRSLPT